MFLLAEVADVADKYQKSLLTADVGCQYDSVIEINLDTVCILRMLVNILETELTEIMFLVVAILLVSNIETHGLSGLTQSLFLSGVNGFDRLSLRHH